MITEKAIPQFVAYNMASGHFDKNQMDQSHQGMWLVDQIFIKLLRCLDEWDEI